MPDSFKLRVAIVTGASSGIGRALTLGLITDGFAVLANGRNEARLQSLIEAANAPSRLSTVIADAALQSTPRELVHQAKEVFGRAPSLYVVNAGHGLPGTVLSSQVERWPELFRVNVYGGINQLREFALAIRSDFEGGQSNSYTRDIVVVGSSIGRNISPTNPMYGATKFALHAATESVRREVAPIGIRVTLIEPGIVDTAFQENAGYDPKAMQELLRSIGPVLSAEDVADVIRFIVSRPPHVHLSEIMIRPTRQAYP